MGKSNFIIISIMLNKIFEIRVLQEEIKKKTKHVPYFNNHLAQEM